MPKPVVFYRCQSCGYTSPKSLGKCPECEGWNTFELESQSSQVAIPCETVKVYHLDELEKTEKKRIVTGISELDRVLGGGIVPGSVILIGGEPGIGKSTLLLEVASAICNQQGKVLYASGEESPTQLSLRAERLGIKTNLLLLAFETDLDQIESIVSREKPDFLVIDSIQTVYCSKSEGTAGSVSQVRESTNYLVNLAKRNNITVWIVGHVTKDGQIAGPKFLEHLVDVVLYLEGEKTSVVRLLRGQKNRYGETSEIGVFSMGEKGLLPVQDPSELFIFEKELNVPGTLIFPSLEGVRTLFLEVQALCTPSFLPIPRRVVTGFDFNRVIMLMAILEKRVNLRFSNLDVFVNVTGGVKITEPASDLAVALSLASSLKEIPLKEGSVVFGELGLSGEIRPVPNSEKRIVEALRRNFSPVITGRANLSKEYQNSPKVHSAGNLREAIEIAMK